MERDTIKRMKAQDGSSICTNMTAQDSSSMLTIQDMTAQYGSSMQREIMMWKIMIEHNDHSMDRDTMACVYESMNEQELTQEKELSKVMKKSWIKRILSEEECLI